MSLKIKEEFKATVVGYNHSGLPLRERDDLHLLAEMAQTDPFIANLFEELPTAGELSEYKEKLFLETHPAPAPEVQNAQAEVILPETATNTEETSTKTPDPKEDYANKKRR